MKAYRIESNKKIEPFGDHPHDCLIANRKLSEIQEEVLQGLGLELEATQDPAQVQDPDEHIVLEDSLFFTKEVLQEFIARSRKLKGSTVCALKSGVATTQSMVATQDVRIHDSRVEYGLRYMAVKGLRGEPVPIVIDPDQFFEIVPMPEHLRGERDNRIAVTDMLLVQVDHWANLWAANMGTLLAQVARLRKAPKSRLVYLALRARSLNKWKVFCQANKIGKNCDIHPTAYIEGSSIGDHVTVGAGTVIRLSHIGARTTIGSNVTIECSVVGEGCALDSMSGAFASVLYPGTASSAKLIFISVCGRDSFLADGVVLADFRFDRKNVTVMKDGLAIDTGNIGLGVCLGHGVYLGAGCVVAPGRAIENGLRIVPEGTRVISQSGSDGSVPGHRTVILDDQ
ncbi:MAG: hypothetical protein V3R87_01785 [Dehalococcoidia bacterium]